VTADEALEQATEAGIHRLAIPTPFAVGRVNCYLLEDDPLTLVDTGPNSGKALDELERQLGELGRRIEDLELVVISHQHIDHLGLIEIVAKRSGAEVAAIDVAVERLRNFSADAEADDEFAGALMRRYGIPDDVVEALRAVSRSFRGWGAPADVTRPLGDGERLELRDRSLEVQHRPGHSPSDTVFWDERRRILLSADHLIAHISSNPLLSRPLDGSDRRPRALIDYIASMRRTRELPAELVLPGHGDPITDHRALIDERLAMHRRRAAKLLGLIREEPRSAYELAQALWGNVAVTQAFLTLSEVVGHADILVEGGLVAEAEGDDGIARFEPTGTEGEVRLPGDIGAAGGVTAA
jgi:glyoxylase-like metal-dependent hydrolase (beta-lactamase superfamily II)